MLIGNFHDRKQGGTGSRLLLKLTGRILLLADQLQIQLILRHITGQPNVLANLASRMNQVVPSEWSLCDPLPMDITDVAMGLPNDGSFREIG